MNLYSIFPFISSILFLVTGVFVLSRNRKSIVNQAFMLTCVAAFWWQFSWFMLFNTTDEGAAFYLIKLGYAGIIFIPITFFHFFVCFLGPGKLDKIILYSAYALGLIFEIFLWGTSYFVNGFYKYHWGFYPRANFLHPLYLALLSFLTLRAVYLLVSSMKRIRKEAAYKYNQVKYVFLSLLFYISASSDFMVNYGAGFYLMGFVTILFLLGIFAYAIIKYRLMDIKVAITRGGIFLFVYAFVLGVPFVIGYYTKSWFLPTFLMAVLATAGPFVYG